MELVERLSTARLERLKAGLQGVKAQTALLVLADSSVFLDPPATEILANSVPDQAALYRMMATVVNYLDTAIHQLPNFIATREITGFENQPPQLTSRSTTIVTYRDHQEVVEKADAKSKFHQPETPGLVTHGVFGPILSTVLKDALTGSIRWGRWEAGTKDAVAVILYAVPLEKSHYSVWPRRSGSAINMSAGIETAEPVAYHGEIAFDPASGAILRLVVVAEMPSDELLTRDDVVVEYGAMEIGGKSYICPVRSVSLLIEHNPARYNEFPQRFLNDVVYRKYHRFGSESRILIPGTIEPAGNP
jgi:hypothetical protein